MKRILLALFAVAALVCVAASSAPSVLAATEPTVTDHRTVLSTTTTNGVTTTLYVGRVQTDPSKDGGAVLTVYPARVLTDSAGNVLNEALDTSQAFSVPLTADQYSAIASIITAAWQAKLDADAAAAAATTTTTTTTTAGNTTVSGNATTP